ncbi:Regulation of nuclear pre-mRNA domain-containing protein 1A, partial [Varanus komodoensis]
EYKRKLTRVSQVRKELKSRIQSLPDLSRLPNVTGILPVEKLYLLLIDTKEKEKALWMEGGIPPPHTEFQAATEMRGERRSFL